MYIRKLFIYSVYSILTLCLYSQLLGQKLTPQDILGRIDEYRGLQNRSFSLKMKIDSTVDGKLRDQMELISYIDNESTPGQWNTLVRTTAPTKRKGQLMLLENNRMWFYKPGTRRSIRISPAQRLLGGASTGDVAAFNFQEYYDVESIDDVKLGKIDAHLLKLKARPDTAATYSVVHVWAQKKTYRPIQAEFYAESGRKLKSAYYGGFKKILNHSRVTEMVIVDGLRPDNVTKIYTVTMKAESLPQKYYKPDQLTSIGF